MKIYKILGKSGRITIPFAIRKELDLEQLLNAGNYDARNGTVTENVTAPHHPLDDQHRRDGVGDQRETPE